MERHGWRAIIYDAPWASFKRGQVGVVISEDGKSCETFDDDKSSIIIEADINLGFEPRTNGHVLFRQKGSDLFDIVCLYQEYGGTYDLKVEDVEVNGCENVDSSVKYNKFISDLKITETINGKAHVLTIEEKYNIISDIYPKQSSFSRFVNTGDSEYIYEDEIKVTKRNATASADIIVLPSGEEEIICGDIEIFVGDIPVEILGSSCYAEINPDGGIGEGGIVKFSVTTEHVNKYGIKISDNVSANIHCDHYKCGKKTGEEDIPVTNIKYYYNDEELVIKEGDYYIINVSDDTEVIELKIVASDDDKTTTTYKTLILP